MNIRRQNGNFRFGRDVFSKGAHGKAKIVYEAIKIKKFLQRKPEAKKMNFK